MILVDTSVWIDDLRRPSRKLRDRVDAGDVLSHEMVIGELACGNLPDRDGFLQRLGALPAIRALASEEVLTLIGRHAWMGRGIGYVDASLLGAVVVEENATLWTKDRNLRRLADEMGVAHTPDSEDR